MRKNLRTTVTLRLLSLTILSREPARNPHNHIGATELEYTHASPTRCSRRRDGTPRRALDAEPRVRRCGWRPAVGRGGVEGRDVERGERQREKRLELCGRQVPAFTLDANSQLEGQMEKRREECAR